MSTNLELVVHEKLTATSTRLIRLEEKTRGVMDIKGSSAAELARLTTAVLDLKSDLSYEKQMRQEAETALTATLGELTEQDRQGL